MTKKISFGEFLPTHFLQFMQKMMLLLFAIFTVNSAFAQNDTGAVKYKIAKPNSTDKNNSSNSNIDLDDPLKLEWKYNAKTNRYESFKQLGSLSYPTGQSLSVTEYFQMVSKDKNSEYYRKKTQNTDYSQPT